VYSPHPRVVVKNIQISWNEFKWRIRGQHDLWRSGKTTPFPSPRINQWHQRESRHLLLELSSPEMILLIESKPS
jgi:hypothetical protein